jgi:hypothetical protein
MKHFLTTLAGAVLFAGAATLALAQTAPTQPQTNPNTKVYAYKKTAPAKSTAPGVTNSPSENLMGSVPWGSLKWWEVRGRTEQPSD